jgi:gamma-glutamylcyclotransferase (GGCT)/AIG2-like uncharacterized protein YtfP
MALFFAYGTLRRGAASPPDIAEALARAEYLARARARGCLHRLGAFSALIRSQDAADLVVGDLYQIDEALWPTLDSYEGDAYVREMVSVTLEDGARLDAFAYFARDPQSLGPRIPSGDALAS